MKNGKKLFVMLLVVCAFVSSYPKITSADSYKRATYYRGSVLMWTRDNVDFYYNSGIVRTSSGYQQSGWIFPNISRNRGITRYYSSSPKHSWRATNEIGAGVPTPWGDVKVYATTFTHRLHVYGSGSWSAYSD